MLFVDRLSIDPPSLSFPRDYIEKPLLITVILNTISLDTLCRTHCFQISYLNTFYRVPLWSLFLFADSVQETLSLPLSLSLIYIYIYIWEGGRDSLYIKTLCIYEDFSLPLSLSLYDIDCLLPTLSADSKLESERRSQGPLSTHSSTHSLYTVFL